MISTQTKNCTVKEVKTKISTSVGYDAGVLRYVMVFMSLIQTLCMEGRAVQILCNRVQEGEVIKRMYLQHTEQEKRGV